jgi:hypothetical protein
MESRNMNRPVLRVILPDKGGNLDKVHLGAFLLRNFRNYQIDFVAGETVSSPKNMIEGLRLPAGEPVEKSLSGWGPLKNVSK